MGFVSFSRVREFQRPVSRFQALTFTCWIMIIRTMAKLKTVKVDKGWSLMVELVWISCQESVAMYSCRERGDFVTS